MHLYSGWWYNKTEFKQKENKNVAIYQESRLLQDWVHSKGKQNVGCYQESRLPCGWMRNRKESTFSSFVNIMSSSALEEKTFLNKKKD